MNKLPANGEVLELGSAFGRDARYMASKGFKVLCTDIIPQALEKLAQEGFETATYDFRNKPNKEWEGKFDGFFANAVLLHAPQDIFEQALNNLLVVLKAGGVEQTVRTGAYPNKKIFPRNSSCDMGCPP